MISKHIQQFKSLPGVAIFTGLIIVGALIVGAWYLGTEWWMAPIYFRYSTRPSSRLEVVGVIAAFVTFFLFCLLLIDRDRDA